MPARHVELLARATREPGDLAAGLTARERVADGVQHRHGDPELPDRLELGPQVEPVDLRARAGAPPAARGGRWRALERGPHRVGAGDELANELEPRPHHRLRERQPGRAQQHEPLDLGPLGGPSR